MPKISKENLDWIKSALSILRSVVIGIGALIVVTYCTLEKVMPDGLSLGDAFFLVYVTFGFGLLASIGTIYGAFSTLGIVHVLIYAINRWRPKSRPLAIHSFLQGKWFFILSWGLLIIFVASMIWAKGAPDMRPAGTIGFFLLLGFFCLTMFGIQGRERKPLGLRNIAAIVSGTALVAALGTHPALLNFTMGTMGVRSLPGDLIVISDKDHDRIDEMAKLNNIKVSFCPLPRSSQWATLDARAVWNNIGATSYLQILDEASDGLRNIVVPIPRTELDVARAQNIKFSCSDKTTSAGTKASS